MSLPALTTLVFHDVTFEDRYVRVKDVEKALLWFFRRFSGEARTVLVEALENQSGLRITLRSPAGRERIVSLNELQCRKAYALFFLENVEHRWFGRTLEDTIRKSRGSKTQTQCWIHPRYVNRSKSGPQDSITHECNFKQRTFRSNLGLAVKLFRKVLTIREKYGIIFGERDDVPWQLSHLCGDWRCVNPSHAIMESRDKNLKRKRCHRNGCCTCKARPACMFPPMGNILVHLKPESASQNGTE